MFPPDNSEDTDAPKRNPQFDRQTFRHGVLKDDYERLKSVASDPNIDLKSLKSQINKLESRLRGFITSEKEYREKFTLPAAHGGSSKSRLASVQGMLNVGLSSMKKTLAEREAALLQQRNAEQQQNKNMREALSRQKAEEAARERQKTLEEAERQKKESREKTPQRNPQFDRQRFRHGTLKDDYEHLKSEASDPNIDLKSFKSKINKLENRLRDFITSEKEYQEKLTLPAAYGEESKSRLASVQETLNVGLGGMKKTLAEREAALHQQQEAEQQQKENMKATLKQQRVEQAEANRIQKEQRSVLLSRSGMAVSVASDVFKGGTNKEVKDMLSELKRIRADLEKELKTPGVQGSPLLKHKIESHMGLLSGMIGKGESSFGFMGTMGRLLGRFGVAGAIAGKILGVGAKIAWKAAKLPTTINNVVQGIASASAPATDYIRQTSQIARAQGSSGQALRNLTFSVSKFTSGTGMMAQVPDWMRKYKVSPQQLTTILSGVTRAGAEFTGRMGIAQEIARARFDPRAAFAGISQGQQEAFFGNLRGLGALPPGTNMPRFTGRFKNFFNVFSRQGINNPHALDIFQNAYSTAVAGSPGALVDPNSIERLSMWGLKTGSPQFRTPGGTASAVSGLQAGAGRLVNNPGGFSLLMSQAFPGLTGNVAQRKKAWSHIMGLMGFTGDNRKRMMAAGRYEAIHGNLLQDQPMIAEVFKANPNAYRRLLPKLFGNRFSHNQAQVLSHFNGLSVLTNVAELAGVHLGGSFKKGDLLPRATGGPSSSYTGALGLSATADMTSLEASINVFKTLGVVIGNLAPTIDNLNKTIVHANVSLVEAGTNMVDSIHHLIQAMKIPDSYNLPIDSKHFIYHPPPAVK